MSTAAGRFEPEWHEKVMRAMERQGEEWWAAKPKPPIPEERMLTPERMLGPNVEVYPASTTGGIPAEPDWGPLSRPPAPTSTSKKPLYGSGPPPSKTRSLLKKKAKRAYARAGVPTTLCECGHENPVQHTKTATYEDFIECFNCGTLTPLYDLPEDRPF